MSAPGDVLEPVLIDTIERYFTLLQAHVPAEEMLTGILTEDFGTGFEGGYVWQGEAGLRDFLRERSVFFDESHEVLQILDIRQEAPGSITARTRLRFFLRGREAGAARSEEYAGEAFHRWRLRRRPRDGRWCVAAQIVEGFAALNTPARRLFAAPAKGMRAEST
ncbi:hypothetical protein [Streptomyces spongiae]|uniref:Nuclear transport factor 2 family protein n=1 Tax=Streptomyces spongiae TaxID=565072 RepID=A0A5N8XA00_9ACTN|nr:hypothetical protein [Streptomyces spongiae]MPY56321.1 hypothetical protein [Streptomyces spongiae]